MRHIYINHGGIRFGNLFEFRHIGGHAVDRIFSTAINVDRSYRVFRLAIGRHLFILGVWL